ncbi:MAG TPA: NADH:ubiquinone reductase (Na(+)-transporting) subunit B [Bacteroidales bacterium]|jgi:Na+-transporting NADH:ubiquinone oxidoreductase subunit B|nr:NADH:ubiquinone reductase (Na(+)-transporting) subunit B [Bacteroidales bacterium]
MKSLRRYIDKIKPHFEKGGRFEKLESTFEAFESFLFVSNKVTSKGTHIRDANDMKRTMIVVVIALIPTIIFGMWNVGLQHFRATGQEGTMLELFWLGFIKVFPIIVVSYVVGLGIEFAFAQYRGHEVNEGFLVSGILIPLVLPVDVPLWMVAVATAFAVVIGKEVFGGTGMNILNPALTARAFLFFAYPSYMSGNAVWTHGMMNGEGIIDSYSGATPLAEAAAGNISNLPSVAEMFFGTISGSIGETSTLAILIGAAILIITGIGSARIMISTVIGGLVIGLLLNIFAVNPFMEIPFWQHLLLGGFAFGAVFMATDPVSASQTPKGKIIYGFLIGFLAILIRVINPAYPEGVMLAILLMNVFAPLIDHYVIEGNIKKRLKRAKVKA